MPEKYRVTATTLNVRQGPSITEKIIGILQKSDAVELISKSGDGYWFKVKNDSIEGWASHKYLELVVPDSGIAEVFSWMPIALELVRKVSSRFKSFKKNTYHSYLHHRNTCFG